MKALHYINDVYQPDPFYERYPQNGQDGVKKSHDSQNHPFDTHLEIYRPQRFEQISTIVVDYSSCVAKGQSAELSPLELLEHIKHPHIQKILLVEEVDDEIASQALANGLIQYVVCKDDLAWEENLYEVLQDAQWAYFNRLSEIFMSSTPGKVREFAIDDPNFQRLFKTIINNYGFTEAYICETTGSYLFLDDQAQDHGLVVSIPEQLDHWVRSGKDKGISHPLLKELKNRTKMMCYHRPDQELEPDKRHWDIYAHPARTIKGEHSTYYYAFAPNLYDIDVERILPFDEYREIQQKRAESLH